MNKPFQKISENTKIEDGYYYPKYSAKRIAIAEEEFIEVINQTQLGIKNLINEHILIKKFQNNSNKISKITSQTNLLNREYVEKTYLLFYHWYERRYKKNIINSNILYSLNSTSITSLYDKFGKDDLGSNIFEKLEKHLRSKRFPNFTVYYEYFYDFFPLIENFTYEEIKQKEFLLYLLELFPKICAINYKDEKCLWRLTDVELEKLGDSGHNMAIGDRHKSHNAITYNTHNLPCFYPSALGEKNYEEYKIGSETHTPFFKIVKFKLRNIENEYREDRSLPKIGEGWISETLLYYKIKTAIKDYDVVQHGRPTWLGAQHFDIYLPTLNIAIEYQGIQHEKPIEHFGGESSFKKNKERDERKRKLCFDNNCILLYVFPNENFDEFTIKLEKTIHDLINKI